MMKMPYIVHEDFSASCYDFNAVKIFNMYFKILFIFVIKFLSKHIVTHSI